MGDLIKRQLVKVCVLLLGYIVPRAVPPLQWEAKYPTPSSSMSAIVKHIMKLYEALVDILPSDQLSVGGVLCVCLIAQFKLPLLLSN